MTDDASKDMNAKEKSVLRRKRHLLATHVNIDDDVIKELKEHGLIWDAIVDQLKVGQDITSYARTSRYLDLLMKLTTDTNTFKELCDFLDNDVISGDYPWLGEELRAELRTETGGMALDEYVRREAGELVHAYFGKTKRLSEREKRLLEQVIAQRSQCAKEIWRKNFELTKVELEKYKAASGERDTQLRNLMKTVASYIQVHRKTIFRIADDTGKIFKSSSTLGLVSSYQQKTFVDKEAPPRSSLISLEDEISQTSPESGKLIIDKLSQAVEELNTLAKMYAVEYNNLLDEKSRALAVLDGSHRTRSRTKAGSGAGDRDSALLSNLDGVTARLDVEIATWMQKVSMQLSDSRIKAKDAERQLSRIDEKLASTRIEHDDEMKGKDQTIGILSNNLESLRDHSLTLESELRESKRCLRLARAELERMKVKAVQLQKSRHFGYLYDCYTPPSERQAAWSERKAWGGGGGRRRNVLDREKVSASEVNLPRIDRSPAESPDEGGEAGDNGSLMEWNLRKSGESRSSKVGPLLQSKQTRV